MTERQALLLMLQVARLYYEQGQTQEEVAQTLGISRPKVSRVLQRARQEGIVQIRINDPFSTQSTLEQALIDAFDLRDVRVAAGQVGGVGIVRKRIGGAAARYLEETLADGQKVGIGWGRTLHATVTALAPPRQARISVVPLLGGLAQIAPSFQVHELARRLAEAFGGTWQPLYAPAMLEDETAWSSLIRSNDLAHMASEWARVDVAVVGIGNVAFDVEMQMLFADYLDHETQRRLKEAQAVGDLCVRFFDIHGQPCPEAIKHVVGIGLEQLRSIPRVIGIAGGADKVEAILGALRGRYINTLITDEAAARGILMALGQVIPTPAA